jgi:glycerophosphoryl diester phosphodiesterase
MHPFLDHGGPLAFAHRGGAAEAHENTMAAFQRVIDMGFEYLELDVRTTADEKLVVFHDATLDRVAGRPGRVGRMRSSDLAHVRVGGAEPIPLLAEVLHTWPDVRVNIDPKCDAAAAPLVGVLRDADALDRVCVMAFSDRRIARLRRALGPRLCTALGPASMARLRLAANGVRIESLQGEVAQVPASLGGVRLLDSRVARAAQLRGLPLHAWVVDEPSDMHRLLDLVVTGIMTDRPTVLRDVLAARGSWSGQG